tara:strand:- start:402 stop:1043 length:642 start_codon:yes stop_codon:yes gene_type:complete
LFAALSYAVTNSGRGGGGIDKEQTEIAVAQFIQSVGQIQSSLQRLQIIKGCSDTEISFIYDSNNDGVQDTNDEYRHFSGLSRTDCRLFHPDGAGLTFPEIPADINNGDPVIFSSFANVPGVGTSESELIMFAPYLTLDACNTINERIDAPTDNGLPIEEGSSVSNGTFTGIYVAGAGINNMDSAYAGCFNGTNFGDDNAVGDSYFYYSVLIAR